jgi:serine/threonine protein kinase
MSLFCVYLQVIGTISSGAFGKVYKVIKKDTNEIYALKVLSKSQVQHTFFFTFSKIMLSCTMCLLYVAPQSELCCFCSVRKKHYEMIFKFQSASVCPKFNCTYRQYCSCLVSLYTVSLVHVSNTSCHFLLANFIS